MEYNHNTISLLNAAISHSNETIIPSRVGKGDDSRVSSYLLCPLFKEGMQLEIDLSNILSQSSELFKFFERLRVLSPTRAVSTFFDIHEVLGNNHEDCSKVKFARATNQSDSFGY